MLADSVRNEVVTIHSSLSVENTVPLHADHSTPTDGARLRGLRVDSVKFDSDCFAHFMYPCK
jgi:hypothetical protein